MKSSIAVIIDGFKSVKLHYKALSKALVIPVLLMLIINYVPLILNFSESSSLWLMLVSIVPMTLIAITTHKIILEGAESVPEWGINSFGKRELKFIGAELLLGICLIPVFILGLIPVIGFLLGRLILYYLISRVALVFPSIALGKNMTFIESWHKTKKHQLMMCSAVAVFPFLIGLIQIALSLTPNGGYITGFFSIISMVLVVASLSTAYRIIEEESSI